MPMLRMPHRNPRELLDGHILQRGCAVVLTNEVLTRFLET